MFLGPLLTDTYMKKLDKWHFIFLFLIFSCLKLYRRRNCRMKLGLQWAWSYNNIVSGYRQCICGNRLEQKKHTTQTHTGPNQLRSFKHLPTKTNFNPLHNEQCPCAPIITDESGVIWLKCNNTVQIWHNPAHPSNWPVEWQSGRNLPITVSDLPSFKTLWSLWGMRRACNRISFLCVCPYINSCDSCASC